MIEMRGGFGDVLNLIMKVEMVVVKLSSFAIYQHAQCFGKKSIGMA